MGTDRAQRNQQTEAEAGDQNGNLKCLNRTLPNTGAAYCGRLQARVCGDAVPATKTFSGFSAGDTSFSTMPLRPWNT
jgi:hypothetical protein